LIVNYKGSCHCGKVAFEVEGEIKEALACNCSMCGRRGSLLIFVPHGDLKLLSPDAAASTYTFNKHAIKHRFCAICGIHTFGEGTDRNGNAIAAINIRTLENVDLDAIPVQHYNGRAL
jgi:hypothetical protein